MKHIISIIIIALMCLNSVAVYASTGSKYETVILSFKNDPYYSLAEEISGAEGIPVYDTFDEAAEAKPVFLLWVAAPTTLSESALIDFSNKLNHLDTSISVGIISGKTIEDARNLWEGASQIKVKSYTIINGTKGNKIRPEIIYGSDVQTDSTELSRENILAVLKSTNVIQISLEGAAGSWFDQSKGITMKSADIPDLDACIIQNYGCSTFRPWAENSIALECINKGAKAYCGFVYSSVAGTRFGDYTDISTINMWDKFPLGHLVQIQNHAAMQSYANSPHYFMLGDPRIYCRSKAPYEMVSDETSGDIRTIKLTNVESGLIPIYIENGAGYGFVRVPGLSSSAMESACFDSRLQMIDINSDKYIIIDNNSDMVTIELRKEASLFQTILNNISGFLDSVCIQNQGSSQPLIIALPLLILLAIGMFRKRYSSRQLVAALIFGTATALVSLIYILVRLDHIEVTNIPVKVNWFFIMGIFIFAGYGELLYSSAKGLKGKLVAVLAANLNTLVSVLIFTGGMLVRQFAIGNKFSINKPGYPWLFEFYELIEGIVFFYAMYYLYNRLLDFPKKVKDVIGGM